MDIIAFTNRLPSRGYLAALSTLKAQHQASRTWLVTIGNNDQHDHEQEEPEGTQRYHIPLPLEKSKLFAGKGDDIELFSNRVLDVLLFEHVADARRETLFLFNGSWFNALISPIKQKLKGRIACFADQFSWEATVDYAVFLEHAAIFSNSGTVSSRKLEGLTAAAEKAFFEASELIIAPNRETAVFLTRAYGVPERAITYGSSKEPGSKTDRRGYAAPDSINTHAASRIVFVVAGGARTDDIILFIKCIPTLGRLDPRLQFVIYGVCDYAAVINISDHAFASKITFTGEMSQKWKAKWLKATEAVVLLPVKRTVDTVLDHVNNYRKPVIAASQNLNLTELTACPKFNFNYKIKGQQCTVQAPLLIRSLKKALNLL